MLDTCRIQDVGPLLKPECLVRDRDGAECPGCCRGFEKKPPGSLASATAVWPNPRRHPRNAFGDPLAFRTLCKLSALEFHYGGALRFAANHYGRSVCGVAGSTFSMEKSSDQSEWIGRPPSWKQTGSRRMQNAPRYRLRGG